VPSSSKSEANGGSDSTTRRNYLQLAGAGTLGASTGLLTGYVDGATLGQANQSQTTITFWHTEPEEQRRRTIAAQVEKFQEQSDSPVSVNVRPVDEETIGQQVLAGAQAGTLPTVIMTSTRFTQQLGARGLLDSNAAAEAIDAVGRDRFRTGPLNLCRNGEGGHFAVPHDCFVTAFYYRASKFNEEGLEPPETWDALRQSAQTLHDPGNNQYGISIGDGNSNITNQNFQHIALSHNARLFNENGEVTFNTPEMIDALRLHGELGNLTPPGYQAAEGARDTYLDELTYNVNWSTYITDDILYEDLGGGGEEMLDDSHLVTLLQDGNGNQGTFGLTQGFNILNTQNRGVNDAMVSAATDMVSYFFNPEAYIPWLHLAPAGFRPTISGITDNEQYKNNEVLQAWDDQWEQQVADAIDSEYFSQFGFPGDQVFPEVGNITGQYLTAEAVKEVVDGGDPQQVAEKYQQRMEEAIA
jgi:multiple sugar transport system substrate-binding protein